MEQSTRDNFIKDLKQDKVSLIGLTALNMLENLKTINLAVKVIMYGTMVSRMKDNGKTT